MPSANVYNMDGEIVREEELDGYVFGAPVNTAVLHQVVTAQLTNRRQGNASTKTRAHVSGGGKKPEIVHKALREPSANLPSQKVKPTNGKLMWYLDKSAASKL